MKTPAQAPYYLASGRGLSQDRRSPRLSMASRGCQRRGTGRAGPGETKQAGSAELTRKLLKRYGFVPDKLALLWQIQFCPRLEPHSAMGTSLRWLVLCQRSYYRASDGWQGRLRRAVCLLFFPALPCSGADVEGRHRQPSSSTRVGGGLAMIGLQNGRGRVLPSFADGPARRPIEP